MIERSGTRLILPEIVASVLAYFLMPILNLIILPLIAFTIFFFRDPPREIQEGVVSPADGRIDFIADRELEIFMGPFDCHINRSPVSGRVEKIIYKRGRFIPAYHREDSAERNEIFIKSDRGTFKVIQIAGFFARRISCYVKEGEWVEKGEKIGMIKFGSRVRLELPPTCRIIRKVGERVRAGETVAVET